MTRLAVRVPDPLLEQLDELAGSAALPTRSAAVRAALVLGVEVLKADPARALRVKEASHDQAA